MAMRWIGLGVLILVLSACSRHFARHDDGLVRVTIFKPKATAVEFACSLDGYQYHPTTPQWPFRWQAVVPAAQQEFKYFFLVDGEIYLPSCWFKENDDFGSQICIFVPDL